VIFLESLPKMSGWKVLYRELREKYGGFPKGKEVSAIAKAVEKA
jgi:acyl-CoA synthetase (AMP-forming)/AMP-acid ligase II